jgi:small subunit ribosomal protein S33
MVKYYPQSIDIAKVCREYPELELINEVEEQRLIDIEDRKKRGKGAPTKAKTMGVFRI